MQRIAEWEEDLGLLIETPFSLSLHNGYQVKVPLLIRQFGGENGTLVTDNYDQLAPHVHELSLRKFGTATWDFNGTHYDRQSFIEMLSEWGWEDEQNHPPQWLINRSAE
jgi:hypothetical protein